MTRLILFIVLLLISFPVFAQNAGTSTSTSTDTSSNDDKPVLIGDISMEGFVLGDKEQFTKIFKPYRKKRHLTKSDMDDILSAIQLVYERNGYQELVSIQYEVKRKNLIFTVSMVK